ncbi:uncharacterized protein LOC112567460 [Pomacea canaliculata]|uniref:uncharacterized protein LOC112567460 n=1 Tax=Pomacea canaliculata TaxID=400727 RepID=UPI000D73EEEE|nr:uncharacterized protein LOC112567460 [Pomacea canaliculata]
MVLLFTLACRPDDLNKNFTDYPGSALRANLLYGEDGLTVEACKGRCQTNQTCLTFDFKAHGGLCRLHNVTSRDSPSDWSPKRSKGWTHYQRSCNSTFASHDNWHNLLCESRVDCPDTNSDCLSGRCLCRSGSKFNEPEKKCVVTKLSKWHNTSCTTEDDCDVHHATCYKQLCRCHPGYFYTTQDTCTDTCSTGELQDNFTDYPDSALRGNLLDSEDGISLEACKGRCQADKRCLTFDFKVHGGLCLLHAVTARDSPSHWYPKRSIGWTHYQRSCNSTFASHDTWYNLLCNNKMDCADTNSDCLSGRCLCGSGFKFNETKKECVVTRSCVDWQDKGAKSGVYTIQLYYKGPLRVWCDMYTAGGGWTVIQRRRAYVWNPYDYVDFNRNWTEYANGFGDISGDFWLGLSAVNSLIGFFKVWRMRVDISAGIEGDYWAEYGGFMMASPRGGYRLYVWGNYSGTAGDGLKGSHMDVFHTYDRNLYGCVSSSKGAWWYWRDCAARANLNSPVDSEMFWADIGFLESSEMKIRP